MSDWEGPRTQPSFWTPSITPLERRLSTNSLSVQLYRALRICWVLSLVPLHLALVALALSPPVERALPPLFCPGKRQRWNPQQRLVYPLLRRLIWAVCDVGSPGALTPSEERGIPLWAWLLEEFSVRVGGGARVIVDARDAELPVRAKERGWIKGDVVDPSGIVDFKPVPCFWFEREGEQASAAGRTGWDRWKARDERERVVLYFVGGGFVTGNPSEGSRCYKIARETGLRVVGTNFRKATTRNQAFPAALQDALAVYAHLVLELGYRDIVLGGDSAGGSLSLMLLQYLAVTLSPSSACSLVLPSGILLYSPWSDLTASTYARAMSSRFEDDIICASMATNSIRAFLRGVHDPAVQKAARLLRRDGAAGGGGSGSVYERGAAHPYFSPALPEAIPQLTAVARAYADAAASSDEQKHEKKKRLRILVTTGGAELFHPEVSHLVSNLAAASRSAAFSVGGIGRGDGAAGEPFALEVLDEPNEVHAFPLVPEWISPGSGRGYSRERGGMRGGGG
ncbi:hypothetical protein Rhopal_001343-T1 [Rhodotorula paludigena]|uniref:Alpha/beta hydrolase fold-3 domain-containing protein n=1 Tax=Rhodotorula paludigena TaxID=86838 RepID=A0AAV5GGB3_9BASI|nr:hypothetical protein Rhopal_001343-T1 [Rhodotorula paludigena]